MTDTNSALADEAAQDNDGQATQEGIEPQHAGETNVDSDSETDPAPDATGRTPLDQVTDWAELERRLKHSESTPDHPEESTDGELPPTAPLPHAEDPEGPAAPRGTPRNFRLRTQDPQRARFYQLLRQYPEANPTDLAREAGYGTESPAPAAEPEATPSPKHDAELRETIAELAERRRACREAYDFEQADALTEQLQAAQTELERQEKDAAGADDTQAEFVAAYRDAREQATAGHPALANEGSRQHRLARLLISAKEQQAPEFFEDPAYPLHLVRELEREFPEAFPQRAGDRAPRLAARSRPLGEAVAGGIGGSRELSRVQLERQIDQLSAEQLFALASRVGTPTGGWE